MVTPPVFHHSYLVCNTVGIVVPEVSGTTHFEIWKQLIYLWANLFSDSYKVNMKWILPVLVFINFVLH